MARPHPLPTNPYSADGMPFTPLYIGGQPYFNGYFNLYAAEHHGGCVAGWGCNSREQAVALTTSAPSRPFARVRVILKPGVEGRRSE
jgi:hypothetical protein